MIQTVAELLAWLPEEQARHQRVDDQRCTCGWQADPLPSLRVDQAGHAEVALLNALLDHLPSNTWGTDGKQVAAGKLIPDLYDSIDYHGEHEARLVEALREITGGVDDPRGRAGRALNDYYSDED